jgi:O-antigen/teichoic acid export membrane protein
MDRPFLKHAATYGLANLLLQAGGFVLLPIYLRCLSRADYGVLELVGRLAETVGTCLLFGGFRQALLTFYQQAGDETERRGVVSSTLTLFTLSALLGGALALALSPLLCAALAPAAGGDSSAVTEWLIRLAILCILLEPFSLIPITLIQARVQSGTYIVVVVGQFLLRLSLCVLLVRFLRWGVAGALTATAVTGAMFGVALSARELRRGTAWPSGKQLRTLLAFALPLMPGGLCFFVLHHGDRFFLCRYCSTADVGTYALGYKVAMAVALFSLSPLYMVWSARMYTAARAPDAPGVFGRVFTRILAVYALAGLALCLFADEVVAVLCGAPDLRAARVVTPVLLACLFQGAGSLMDAGLYVCHRTGLKFVITLAGTAVMVLLYALWIPRHGMMGAALATLAGFAFLALCTWAATQRVFPVRYEWLRLVTLLGVAASLWALGRCLPPGGWSIGAKAGLWLLAPVVLWLTGWVSAEEKRYVRDLVRDGLARLARRKTSAVDENRHIFAPPQPGRRRARKTEAVLIFPEVQSGHDVT